LARRTLAAGDVRVDGAAVTSLESGDTFTCVQYFYGKFVPQNARVGEKRLDAAVCMQISAAQAHREHAHESFAGARGPGNLRVGERKASRFFEDDRVHSYGQLYREERAIARVDNALPLTIK
jgi:hypothetical protein